VDQGPCQLCPDGSYIGGNGSCALTPIGTYVRIKKNKDSKRGKIALTPSGDYIEGGRGITLCPDGTFVSGSHCRLMPNGKYLGVM
jgi:hypothetical protein